MNETEIFADELHGERIAECYGTSDEECVANARLIAAAPDLLEALKVAEALIDPHMGVCPMGRREASDLIRAAIAKATGQ